MKTYIYILAVVFVLGLIGTNTYLYNKCNTLNKEVGIYKSNMTALTDQYTNTTKKARVLELKINELADSRDSLIVSLDDTRRKLKIKDDQLRYATAINVQMKDTLKSIIPQVIIKDSIIVKPCDFSITMDPNEYTHYEFNRTDSVFTFIDDVREELELFISEEKVYRNKRKNFFDRLVHLDFKKDPVYNHYLEKVNDRIKIDKIRIIKINN